MGPTAEEELTMPLLDQPCITMLSTTVQMWVIGENRGAKRWSWDIRAAISKSLFVLFPLG